MVSLFAKKKKIPPRKLLGIALLTNVANSIVKDPIECKSFCLSSWSTKMVDQEARFGLELEKNFHLTLSRIASHVLAVENQEEVSKTIGF